MSPGTPEDVTILETIDLSKSFGGFRAVDSVSMRIGRGQVAALIGPNGAGKTTLFNLMSRLIPPTAGQILFEGRDVSRIPPYRLARQGIGRTFQDVRLFSSMTTWDNVAVFAQAPQTEKIGSGLLSPWAVAREKRRLKDRVEEVLEYAGLTTVAHEVTGRLSFAQQKKVAIARCLAQGARLMLLDEPASGLDAEERADVVAMIKRLAADGVTVVVVEHNMEIVCQIAEHAFFLAEGRVVGRGTPERLLESSEFAEIYFGTLRRDGSEVSVTKGSP